jgi:hypothetical protein
MDSAEMPQRRRLQRRQVLAPSDLDRALELDGGDAVAAAQEVELPGEQRAMRGGGRVRRDPSEDLEPALEWAAMEREGREREGEPCRLGPRRRSLECGREVCSFGLERRDVVPCELVPADGVFCESGEPRDVSLSRRVVSPDDPLQAGNEPHAARGVSSTSPLRRRRSRTAVAGRPRTNDAASLAKSPRRPRAAPAPR